MIKIVDGFVWKVLTTEEARAVFENDIFELYQLRQDGSEALIENWEDFQETADRCEFGIEVGHINEEE